MIPTILNWLQDLNNPSAIIPISFWFILSYYLVSAFFIRYAAKTGYKGPWRMNGPIDIVSSVIWCLGAVVLIASLLDLLSRNELPLRALLLYYVLFLFFFAILYNIVGWHVRDSVQGLRPGWLGELQCLSMSVQTMTTGEYTSARPATPLLEAVASIQLLLGVLIIAVFIAKAVSVLATPGAFIQP